MDFFDGQSAPAEIGPFRIRQLGKPYRGQGRGLSGQQCSGQKPQGFALHSQHRRGRDGHAGGADRQRRDSAHLVYRNGRATPKGRFVLRDLVLRMYWDGEETPSVECPLGGAVLSLYPPVGEGDLNEQGLTALCSAGDFDVLITGDMAGSTERKLVGQYDLPDIEVLMVGHHGSRYSSSQELLQAVRPETAIISVGDNSYGHPTQEAMDRLSQAGAEIYRTDRQGNILVTVHGGD